MTRQANLVLGLPATGKTTFLAALWHLAEHQGLNASLAVANLGTNDEHLNEIRDAWLTCTEVERSKEAAFEVVSMELRDRESGAVTRLDFPDLAGEAFENQWLDRQCKVEYAELASRADGVILFVHPQKVVEPVRLEYFWSMLDKNEGEGEGDDDSKKDLTTRGKDATATVLVELLQLLRCDQIGGPVMRRVAVVISAWDLVSAQDPNVTPNQWLNRRLPLLSQFLASNFDVYPHKTFGVSAQGGDYSDAKDELMNIEPAKRIRVVAEDYDGPDLTRVIHWLMRLS